MSLKFVEVNGKIQDVKVVGSLYMENAFMTLIFLSSVVMLLFETF